MTEAFLSFIWKHKLYKNTDLFWEGEKVEIISQGEFNAHAGPDFINAKIRIGNTIWAGNVEIHLKSSDWELHNHDQNAAFDNVILHVTHQYNKDIYTSKGRKVPTIRLQFEQKLLDNYEELLLKNLWIPCADKIKDIDGFTKLSLIESLGIERLEQKVAALTANLNDTISDWEEILYQNLARNFGFHVNAPAFEMLSRLLPLKILQKQAGNIKSIESLLYGVAGFLENDYSEDGYYQSLKNEYQFLKAKYELKTMDVHLWKFLRLRPGNFPTVRIAQMAAIINNTPRLFTHILDSQTIAQIKNVLIQPISEYWHKHYIFSKITQTGAKNLGEESANILIINTVIPFLFLYGRQVGKTFLEDKAINILEKLTPEKNTIINKWSDFGISPKNAFDSQALLQLKNEYCDKKRCLECKIGIKLISTC